MILETLEVQSYSPETRSLPALPIATLSSRFPAKSLIACERLSIASSVDPAATFSPQSSETMIADPW
nr:hypothetical protein [uncultured bacterium]